MLGVRLLGWDSDTIDVRLLSISPVLLLLGLPLLAVGLFMRRWAVVGTAALICMLELVWNLPVDKPWSTAPRAAADGRAVSVFDANISQSNLRPTEIASEIQSDHPQVVAVEELTPQALAVLQRTPLLRSMRTAVLRPSGGSVGIGLWSTLPLTGQDVWTNDGQYEISATLTAWAGPITFDVVHTNAPIAGGGATALWRNQIQQLCQHLAAEPRPLIAAGDFNATTDFPQFRHIMDLGLSDAAVLAGDGWQMTWPRNQSLVPPYLRIDHVLLSQQLTETGYRLGDGEGSDHRPLEVRVALRRSGTSSSRLRPSTERPVKNAKERHGD